MRLDRFESTPDCVDGTVYTGWSFYAGSGEDEAEFHLLDCRDTNNGPQLFVGGEALDPDAYERQIPSFRALVDSPQVQDALRRWHVGLPIVEAQKIAAYSSEQNH